MKMTTLPHSYRQVATGRLFKTVDRIEKPHRQFFLAPYAYDHVVGVEGFRPIISHLLCPPFSKPQLVIFSCR